ncbi:MAG: ABC-three component system protein [Bradyrhizobium sp.]
MMDGFSSIKTPKGPAGLISAAQIIAGPPILPVARIKLYSADDWEEFTNEWAHCSLKKNYHDVVRFGSSGDRGVDIAVFFDKDGFVGAWDGFQCKHYIKPLAPADAKPEIAKVLWYSFNGAYKPPTSYCFVAPCGIGTKLNNLLKNTAALKKDLIDTWDKVCRTAITDTQEVPLEGDFLTYVENFDFSIFNGKQPLTIIEEHRASPHHLSRFGGGLPARPVSVAPPTEIDVLESRYVQQLLDAYSDHTKELIKVPGDLKRRAALSEHFTRQREAFYHAETLRVFVRDKVEPGTFERLQDELYAGVADTNATDHADGFVRVVAVTKAAQDMQLTANPIAPIAQTQDRHGICHQLANEDRLKWTK